MKRADWIGLLGRVSPSTLAARLDQLGDLPESTWLRPPEIGTVMVQGRTGGTGTPFNLGEVTATRCVLRVAEVEGHGIVQGRDVDHARRAALVDALMQTGRRDEVLRDVLAPLAEAERRCRGERAAKAEATRVDFETMVRGEDA